MRLHIDAAAAPLPLQAARKQIRALPKGSARTFYGKIHSRKARQML